MINIAMRKNLLTMLAAILICGLTAASLTACSSSDDDSSSGSNPEEEKPDTTILSLTYHNFITPDDVTILDSDTTKLSVSKALIDKMGAKQLKGRRLAVWQKVSRLPFFRGIVSAQLSGDRYLLDLKRISLEEFMKGIKIKFKNDLYYNGAASTTRSITRSDGTRGEVTDISARYTDPEGYVHPAAVLFTDLDMKDKSYVYVPTGVDDEDDPVFTDPEHRRSMLTRAASDFDGDYDYITPEQGGNFSAEVLDMTMTLKKKFNFGGDPKDTTNKGPIFVNLKIPTKAKANIWGALDYGISGLEYVGFRLTGTMDCTPEVTLGLSKKFELPEKYQTIKIIDLPGKAFVVMAGPVPLVFFLSPALYFRPKIEIEGRLETGFSYNWKGTFECGISWSDTNGFMDYAQGETDGEGFKFIPPQVTAEIIKLRAMLAVGANATLYKVAGPGIYVGPKAELKAKMTYAPYAEEDKRFTCSGTADFSVATTMDLKIDAFGVKEIAKWETEFTLLGPKNIWKYPN